MILYHGTSAESAKKIIEGGFYPTQNNWTCSGNDIYFYPETTEEDNLRNAYENAVLAASLQRSYAQYVSVLICSAPDDVVFPDNSCEYMDHALMVHFSNRHKIQIIEEKKYRYFPEFIPFYMHGVINRTYINIDYPKDLYGIISSNLKQFDFIEGIWEMHEYDY